MPTRSIAVPDAVCDLARRWLNRVGREGDLRRGP